MKCHKAPWPHALNRNVFKKRLNCSRLRHCLRLIGSEFHSRGPAAAKHRSPKMLDVLQNALCTRPTRCLVYTVRGLYHARRTVCDTRHGSLPRSCGVYILASSFFSLNFRLVPCGIMRNVCPVMVVILIFIRQVAAGARICDFFVELWANTRQTDDVAL